MRIIGGKWRSRRLVRPAGTATRPMPDRVKEAVFGILGSCYDCPGRLPPLRVADVFAGGGGVGLEALSRGAAMCYFFERDPLALAALFQNIESVLKPPHPPLSPKGNEGIHGPLPTELAQAPIVEVVPGDAWRRSMAMSAGCAFDLMLVDPPYADSDDISEAGAVVRYLAGLGKLEKRAQDGTLLVLHHAAKSGCEPPDSWRVIDQRAFGSNAITFLVR